MSTNFYLRNKEEYNQHITVMEERNKIVDNIMNQLAEWKNEDLWSIKREIEDIAYFHYEMIHIGKRAGGWMPSFERQEGLFTSVSELKDFYESNKDKYDIIDQYNTLLTWDELNAELI